MLICSETKRLNRKAESREENGNVIIFNVQRCQFLLVLINTSNIIIRRTEGSLDQRHKKTCLKSRSTMTYLNS